MAERFKDKVVFITGASDGIGAEMARQFCAEGACLVLLARRTEKIASVREELAATGARVIAVAGDVTDCASLDAAVASAIEAFGRIDIVLANAGIGVIGPISRLTVEDYRRQFETNFFGVLNTIYAVLPHLQESKGQLGILGSVAGMIGTPATSPYNASKFAIIGLGEAIYHDLDDLGIAVTLINPGFVHSQIRLLNNKGEPSNRPDPVPSWLVLPTDKAARTILNALYRRKPEVIVTFHGKVFAWCKRAFPNATRFVIRRTSKNRPPKF